MHTAHYLCGPLHYNDVIMGTIACQITSLPIVYSIVYSVADQRKHQSSASLAFVWGIHRSPVNSLHKWQVTWKMFPFDDVIMQYWPTHPTFFHWWFTVWPKIFAYFTHCNASALALELCLFCSKALNGENKSDFELIKTREGKFHVVFMWLFCRRLTILWREHTLLLGCLGVVAQYWCSILTPVWLPAWWALWVPWWPPAEYISVAMSCAFLYLQSVFCFCVIVVFCEN